MTKGFQELSELLRFAFSLQNAIKEVLEDKKVNVLDAFKFVPVLPTIKPAFEGLGNPLDRLRELTPDERETLHQTLIDEFDIPNDAIESLVERTVQDIAGTIALAKEWSTLFKN